MYCSSCMKVITRFSIENIHDDLTNQSVLIIDDACGSGATINEVAKKLKNLNAKKVYGYSIVGSYKGFDIISEV